MDTRYPISVRSFTIIVIFVSVGTSILIAPNGLATAAKQDAWIAGLLGTALDGLLALLYAALGDRNPDQTLAEYSEKLLGKWLGMLVTAVFMIYCFFLASLMMGSMGFFMTTQLLQDTPVEVLMLLFVFVVVIALKMGRKVYANTIEFFFPWVVVLMALLLVCVLPILSPSRLLPVYEFGAKPIMKGAYSFFSLQNTVLLLMLYPYVSRGKGRRRALVSGTLVGTLMLVLLTVISIMMLGAEQTANNIYPTYLLAKNISIGNFLERLEGLLVYIWIISIFVRILIAIQCTIDCLARILRIRDEKLLVWPVSLAAIVVGLMSYANMIIVQESIGRHWSAFSLPVVIVIPLLLYFVSCVREAK